MSRVLGRFLAGLILLNLVSAPLVVAQQTAMTPEDLFRTEQISEVSWSPDGRHIAIGISPPLRVLNGSVPNGPLWILDVRTRALRPLPVPDPAMVGAWNPVWSPDGTRLAFLVLDRRAHISPWVWRAGDRVPTRLRDLDVQINYDDPPIVWLDSRRVLFLVWKPGVQKGGDLYMEVLRGQHASELWKRARQGRQASVTVLESGGTAAGAPRAEVVMVELVSGVRRTLLRGRPHRLLASPDGRRLAYFSENPGMPSQRVATFFEHAELYDAVNWGSHLHVLDLASGEESVAPADIVSPGYESVTWSVDGRLALPGQVRGGGDAPGGGSGLLVARDGRFASLGVSGLASIEPASVRWLDGQIVVRGKARPEDRWDWWMVSSGPPRNLTAPLKTAPSALVSGPNGTLLGTGDDDLWRFSPAGAPVNLSSAFQPPITRVGAVGATHEVFTGTVGGRPAILRLVADTVRVTRLEPPREGARRLAVAPSGDAALFTGDFADGTRLWISGGGGRPLTDAAVLWHGNRWVADVQKGETRYFQYTGTDGQPYGGWLLLPAGYTPERRLALIVDVYPGSIQQESASPFAILSTYFLNHYLFAARGYAVLVPSVPAIEGRGAERLRSLTVGVLPAVDTLVARGIVDPERLAVVGQSAGGYATLGLIGETTRFKAAIVSASYSNLASLYGTFYGQHRYGDGGDPQAGQVLRMLQLERGYGRMGAPPWEVPEDYIGASPLFLASKVETPVMLVHGDYDFIPIQQAEEYFTALYRQDKRVQFVRYHGEEHTPSTRGNVLDLWQRIDAWLGELLGH